MDFPRSGRFMQMIFGLDSDYVSESAYETTLRDHLGFRKNLKGSDWKAIATHLDKRHGKESVVTFLGDPLTQRRVDKEVKRYCPKKSNANIPIRGKYGLVLKIHIKIRSACH